MDGIITSIFEYPYKKIGLDELEKIIKLGDYAKLVETISSLIDRQIIKPVKQSGKNGLNPSLYLKYHIMNKPAPDKQLINEINSLHYMIEPGVFRKNTEKYIKNREFILILDDYLKAHSSNLEYPLSENERAYQIWNDEKALDKDDNIALLKSCNVFDKLNTYPTPEPFFDYRRGNDIKNVLVIENKDTWFTVRKLMLDTPNFAGLFGVKIDCVIYGEGRKVTQKNNSLQDYLNIDSHFEGKVWYWGDIDHEGIDIFLSFVNISPELDIFPFAEAYKKMTELFDRLLSADNTEGLKCRTNQRQPDNISKFYQSIDSESAERIKDLLHNGYYIPQEILNYAVLKDYIYCEG